MSLGVVVIALLVLVVSTALTAAMRSFALSRGVLDIPNARSSHAVPTPRGGGVAIVITSLSSLLALALLHAIPTDLAIALGGGGGAVALVGFLDDRYQVPPLARLTVHGAAALWALAWLGGLPPLRLGGHVVVFGWSGYVLGTLGIVWTLNLFNFMDGIDGIAASEAVFIAAAGGALTLLAGSAGAIALVCAMFALGCTGFLLWNWPPAKIFMGDVGSGYIGFFIAVLAIAAARENDVALPIWVILGGVFFVDATVTFVRRLARGERVYEAHRSHAYQWMARRWSSHRRVSSFVLIINVVWLLPCAVIATARPVWAWWMLAAALTPLVVVALAAGAGRSERALEPRDATR